MLRSVSCYTEYNSNDNDNDQTKRTSLFLLRSETTSYAVTSEFGRGHQPLTVCRESVEESDCHNEEFQM